MSVDQPIPISADNLHAIVVSWQPPDPWPTQKRPLQTVSVDNPPFSERQEARGAIVRAWQPPDPQPTQLTKLNPALEAVPEDNPPFSERTHVPSILRVWQPPDPWPTQAIKYYIQLPADPPPIPVPEPNLQVSYWNWIPPDPPPTQRTPLNPAIRAVPEDNPPFSERTHAHVVLRAWQPPDPQPQQAAIRLVQAALVPFSRNWLLAVEIGWLPPAPQPTQPRPRPIVSVDNPPGLVRQSLPTPDPQALPWVTRYSIPAETVVAPSRGWLNTALQAWVVRDVPIQPRRQTSVAVPGFAADRPPAPRQQQLYSPEPQAGPQLPRRFAPIETILTPPAVAWRGVVYEAWMPEFPPPQPPLPPITEGIAVSEPPEVSRVWVKTVLGYWEPPDPLPYHQYILNPLLLKPLKGFRIVLRGVLTRGPVLEGDLIRGPTLKGKMTKRHDFN